MKRLQLSRMRRLIIPGSLRFQLLSRSLFILAALLVLIGVFQHLLLSQFIYKSKADSIRNQIMSIPVNAWQEFGVITVPYDADGDKDGMILQHRGEHEHSPMIFIPDATMAFIDGNGIFKELSNWNETGSAPQLPAQTYTDAMNTERQGSYQNIRDKQGRQQLVVLQPLIEHGKQLGLVQVSMSNKQMEDVLLRQLLIFLSLSLVALLAGCLTFLPVLRRTLVPLSKLGQTVQQIDAGQLSIRIPSKQGQLEIDLLSDSFNGMLQRLETSFETEKEAKEQMRRFIADASHELRTPLTSIHGFLEVLLRGAADQKEQLYGALNSMHGESKRLKKLVEDLLLLAKLDRAPHFQLTKGNLDALIQEMQPQLGMLAGGREVIYRLAPGAACSFEPDKIKQVILNLFHNAVQHTDPERGQITLTLERLPGGVRLGLGDNGPGIDDAHLPHVFERFYRSDTSRTRKYGGAGLGLSISKSIIEAHGGTIEVKSSLGEGTLFIITLPLA